MGLRRMREDCPYAIKIIDKERQIVWITCCLIIRMAAYVLVRVIDHCRVSYRGTYESRSCWSSRLRMK